jgi:predicted HTH transcriptional regulator
MFMPIQIEHAVMEYDEHPLLFIYIPECREKPMRMRGSDIYSSYIRSAGHTVRMSPKQARSYTSGHRFTQTRQYEPID